MEIINSEIPEVIHDRMQLLILQLDKIDKDIRLLNLENTQEFLDFQDIINKISVR